VFDEGNPDDMLGGFSIHCLNEFSQSFPSPNLSHLPPSAVYEAGQLWVLSHEAAQALRRGSMILVGLLQAQALLIYPLIIPRDVSSLYRVFRRVGPPFELPFAETMAGEKIYMQAMLLEGDSLREQVDLASQDGFETQGGHAVIRFKAPSVGENRLTRRYQGLGHHKIIIDEFATQDADAAELRPVFAQSDRRVLAEARIPVASVNGSIGTKHLHRSKENSSSG
jgi:hypothetical protein